MKKYQVGTTIYTFDIISEATSVKNGAECWTAKCRENGRLALISECTVQFERGPILKACDLTEEFNQAILCRE